MLAQVMVAPHATFTQVGWQLMLPSMLFTGSLCAAILGPGVSKAGHIEAPEFATLALVLLSVLSFLGLFAYTSVIDVWEARFWNMPWTDAVPAGKGLISAPFIGQPCPFTGLEPTLRCPCCKAAVHESAFNRIEKKTTFVVGEIVLRWDLATAATEKRSTPAAARVELDEALDLNGNMYYGAIGNCCIGCAIWQRCFNCMPRWSLTCACLAVVWISGPWAFQNAMLTVKNGKSIQWSMLVNALLFCSYAWMVELKRLALAVAFMTRFSNKIAFPNVICAPTTGWKRSAVKFVAGSTAWKFIGDS